MMKSFSIFFSLFISALTLFSCGKENQECVINGVVDNPDLNGKMIFLVPLMNADSTNVDSIEIKEGKFEFRTKVNDMRKILVDYHFRYGTQPLLVVCEPGKVDVTIGATSSATGTKNNDILQEWKIATEVFNKQRSQMMRSLNDARQSHDSARESGIMKRIEEISSEYGEKSKQIVSKVEDGPLKEFFEKR